MFDSGQKTRRTGVAGWMPYGCVSCLLRQQHPWHDWHCNFHSLLLDKCAADDGRDDDLQSSELGPVGKIRRICDNVKSCLKIDCDLCCLYLNFLTIMHKLCLINARLFSPRESSETTFPFLKSMHDDRR